MKPVLASILSANLSDESLPHREHKIEIIEELSLEEFELFLTANAILSEFVSDTELFRLLLLNYQNFYDSLALNLDVYKNRTKLDFIGRDAYLDINRCLLNWLASVRTYLDHLETRIKRRYGEDSLIWKEIKRLQSEEYDNNFSYRFLFKLRNYAQHCGLPANHINFSTVPTDKDPSIPDDRISVSFDRDILLELYKDWGSQLTKELMNGHKLISVNTHIDSMMHSLEKINSKFTSLEFPKLRKNAEFINQLIQRIYPTEGNPAVLEIEFIKDDTGEISNIHSMKDHRINIKLVEAALEGDIKNIRGDYIISTI